MPLSAWRPQAVPHPNPGAGGAGGACHGAARPRPGHPAQVFGQGECVQAPLAARADPIGFGRGVGVTYVGGGSVGATAIRGGDRYCQAAAAAAIERQLQLQSSLNFSI
jgi:hypothetical protein